MKNQTFETMWLVVQVGFFATLLYWNTRLRILFSRSEEKPVNRIFGGSYPIYLTYLIAFVGVMGILMTILRPVATAPLPKASDYKPDVSMSDSNDPSR